MRKVYGPLCMALGVSNGKQTGAVDAPYTGRLLSPKEAAEALRVAEVTLEQWRRLRRHLKFIRVGHAIRYRESDVQAWLKAQEVQTRLVIPSPQPGGVQQFFERVERRTPVALEPNGESVTSEPRGEKSDGADMRGSIGASGAGPAVAAVRERGA